MHRITVYKKVTQYKQKIKGQAQVWISQFPSLFVTCVCRLTQWDDFSVKMSITHFVSVSFSRTQYFCHLHKLAKTLGSSATKCLCVNPSIWKCLTKKHASIDRTTDLNSMPSIIHIGKHQVHPWLIMGI